MDIIVKIRTKRLDSLERVARMQDDKLGKKWFGDCVGGARRADMLKIKRLDNAEGEFVALGVRR